MIDATTRLFLERVKSNTMTPEEKELFAQLEYLHSMLSITQSHLLTAETIKRSGYLLKNHYKMLIDMVDDLIYHRDAILKEIENIGVDKDIYMYYQWAKNDASLEQTKKQMEQLNDTTKFS